MSQDPVHDEVQAALAGEALDALSAGEHARVAEHVAHCAACAADLAALREAAAALAWRAPVHALDPERSARLRSRLVARAAADAPVPSSDASVAELPSAPIAPLARDAGPRPGDPERPAIPLARRGSSNGRAAWLALAASVVLALALGGYALSLRGRVNELSRRVADDEQRRVELLASVADRDSALAGLTERGVKVIDLAATGGREPGGRMFWNPRTDAWDFYGHNLPPLPADREYELWLITPGRKIPAGTFAPSPSGQGRVAAKYALPADSLRAIAVTIEPKGGLPAPSGPIVIVGAVETR